MDKKIKFNVIDFAIILFVILSIFATIFWKDIRNNFKLNEKSVEYTFTARGVTEEELNSIAVEDKLYFSKDETYAGTIKSVTAEKEMITVALADGSLKTYEGDSYVVQFSVSSVGKQGENGFYLGNTYFTVPGKTFSFETDTVTLNAEITSVKS